MEPHNTTSPSPQSPQQPVMDVKPPGRPDDTSQPMHTPPAQTAGESRQTAVPSKSATKPPKPARTPGTGSTVAAIIATVVIVIVLAGLAVYAYLKTNA